MFDYILSKLIDTNIMTLGIELINDNDTFNSTSGSYEKSVFKTGI